MKNIAAVILAVLMLVSCDRGERKALDFLYGNMPLADSTDYPRSFFEKAVHQSFVVRREMPWRVPDDLWMHFVLPLRVNNEPLDSFRTVCYAELKHRVEGLSMKDAILEVNHWCHEKVTYRPSDARTSSPLQTMKTSWGRCGEESTFCVSALRAVGIPARQVYTPRWAHTDDNHAWVEAWADGRWWFMGACEPEPVLDLGWFNAGASRVLLVHTNVFGRYTGPEEVLAEGPGHIAINLTSNYAPVSRSVVQVLDGGVPAEGAEVRFCIYNYAEFYPAAVRTTGADGRAALTAGRGDMLAWASKDGRFGYSKVRFGTDSLVTVRLSDAWTDFPVAIDMVPPVPGGSEPEVTPGQREENDRRFAYEDSVRTAYTDSFVKEGDPLLVASQGNHEVISSFLERHPDARARELLESLSLKDLRDVTSEVLEDAYTPSGPLFRPRVENEFLVPYRRWFLENIPASEQEWLREPGNLDRFVRDSIEVLDTPYAWKIPQSPVSVWKTRRCYDNSRDIFYVALARTLGLEAGKDPVTGSVQTSMTGSGKLFLSYHGKEPADPEYYTHFTISRLEDGVPQLLSFDDGELYTGGGSSLAGRFTDGVSLQEGSYMLTSGIRLEDGSVPVTLQFFSIKEGDNTPVEVMLRPRLQAWNGTGQKPASPLKYGADADSRHVTSIQAQ